MIPGNINQGQHIMRNKKADRVKIWFFIVLGALIPAVGTLIWVWTSGAHI